MTLTGWRRFVDAPPASFDLLPDKAVGGPVRPDRQAYDEARLSYHSETDHRGDHGRPRGRPAGRLLTLLNRAGDQRPPRADRVRAADHRQDHRAQAARPHPRADGPRALPAGATGSRSST